MGKCTDSAAWSRSERAASPTFLPSFLSRPRAECLLSRGADARESSPSRINSVAIGMEPFRGIDPKARGARRRHAVAASRAIRTGCAGRSRTTRRHGAFGRPHPSDTVINPHYPTVAQRAGHRCEYCRAPEAVFDFPVRGRTRPVVVPPAPAALDGAFSRRCRIGRSTGHDANRSGDGRKPRPEPPAPIDGPPALDSLALIPLSRLASAVARRGRTAETNRQEGCRQVNRRPLATLRGEWWREYIRGIPFHAHRRRRPHVRLPCCCCLLPLRSRILKKILFSS